MQSLRFSVEHIGLPARDSVALKDWYTRTLDARVVFDNGETPPAFLLVLGGGLMVEIYAGELSVQEIGHNRLCGFRHLALRVESIEAACDALQARGVVFTEVIKPAGGGGRVLFFKDIEGNLLHLVERGAGFLAGTAS